MDVPKYSIWALYRVIADPLLHDSSLCTLLYIFLLNREYSILKHIGRIPYKLSVLHGWGLSLSLSSMWNTVVISTLLRCHHYHRTTLQWWTIFPIGPREGLSRKPIIPIFGTKGRCFQCWRNVFLTEALNQRTKSNWTEFMSVESRIEQAVTGCASLIKSMLFLVSIMLQID